MEFSFSRPVKYPRFARRALTLAVASITLGIAACGSGPGSATAAGATAAGSGAPAAPELPSITIGVLPSADSVTVQIAKDKGFFKQQGLNVKVVPETTTNAGAQGLLSHTMDFTTENYVGMFSQQNAVKGLNLRIVADNSQAAPGSYVLMVGKNSKLTTLKDLKGKKVGLPAPGFNYGAMALTVLMEPYDLSPKDFSTVILPFSAVQQALANHVVDAIFTTEPFVTTAEAAGDRILQDLMSGPLAGAPQACWGTTASYVRKYPKTVAAFQRAMASALKVAATDPAYVRSELPKFIPAMKPPIANVITLPTYNTTLSLARMQRIANTMERLGALPKGFDVKSMYYPMAGLVG